MKKIELIKEKINIEIKKQQEYKFIGFLLIKKGLTLYEFNPETNELKEIIIVKEAIINYDGEVEQNKRIEYNPNFIYVQALNKKTAMKKIIKNYGNNNIQAAINES